MGNKLITYGYANLIYSFRGYSVMLDFELAALYGVTTKALKQQVRRNIKRFPEDFMFILSQEELRNWRSQFVTSKSLKMGLRHAPMAFTEHGVAMLSSVLRSEKAIKINIEIMRAFSKYRALINDNTQMRKKISSLDRKVNRVFRYLMQRIDELHKSKENKTPLGFRVEERKTKYYAKKN